MRLTNIPDQNAARPDLPEEIAMVEEHTGEIIGSVDRHEAHSKGLWHASIHLWITDVSGNLLFQRRANWVRNFPGKWDISAAGHISVGEDGLRELSEELGVIAPKDELEFLGILKSEHDSEGFINRERPRVYLWRSNLELSDFSFPDQEVMALASVKLSDVGRFIKGNSVPVEVLVDGEIHSEYIFGVNLVPQSKEYWEILGDAVKWEKPLKITRNTVIN